MKKISLFLLLAMAINVSFAQTEEISSSSKELNQDIFVVICGRMEPKEVSMSCLKEVPQFKIKGAEKAQVVSYKISLIDEDGNELILLHDTQKPIVDLLEKAKYLKPVRMVIHDIVVMEGEKINVFNKSFQYDVTW